jgi:hypothetical protein
MMPVAKSLASMPIWATYFIENTHQIATEVENGVNIEVERSYLSIPRFVFKKEEDK